jgi:hypothetical protein
MKMKRFAMLLSFALTAMLVVSAAPDTAEGRHDRGGVYLSGGGVALTFGSADVRARFAGHTPSHRHFGRHRHFRRGFSGASLLLRFGSGDTHYNRSRHYGRRYEHSPRHRFRSDGREYGYSPYGRGRVWVPGRMHEGRYRSGYWEHRGFSDERHDGPHGSRRDRPRGGRGGIRGRH